MANLRASEGAYLAKEKTDAAFKPRMTDHNGKDVRPDRILSQRSGGGAGRTKFVPKQISSPLLLLAREREGESAT